MNKEREARPDAKDALVEMISEEMKRIKDTLVVTKQNIEQTQLVVDRDQQRNADLAAELRTIHENLETLPRQDIRNKYEEALDARFRLTTMRGQLEKFQTAREYLEKEQGLLSQLVAKIQGAEVIAAADDGRKQVAAGSVNIVRIVQAQEDERKRLALQIHDGPAQSLTNFILQAEICQRLFDRNPAKAAEELQI
jgi:two-component system sensor histidine kinase DegS